MSADSMRTLFIGQGFPDICPAVLYWNQHVREKIPDILSETPLIPDRMVRPIDEEP